MSLREHARPMIVVAAIAAAGAIVASAAPTVPAAGADEQSRSCCVANPRFAGTCKVELGPDETCKDVLDYLNNAASAGKTYCGNTNVRVGWKQVECQEES